MSISANEYYIIECSRCKKEVSENAKICPHCGKDIDVMVDKTKEENKISIGTNSVEEADFFKKHNMVRKTLSMFKEEQRSEFQTALNFIEKGAVKRGIFHCPDLRCTSTKELESSAHFAWKGYCASV